MTENLVSYQLALLFINSLKDFSYIKAKYISLCLLSKGSNSSCYSHIKNVHTHDRTSNIQRKSLFLGGGGLLNLLSPWFFQLLLILPDFVSLYHPSFSPLTVSICLYLLGRMAVLTPCLKHKAEQEHFIYLPNLKLFSLCQRIPRTTRKESIFLCGCCCLRYTSDHIFVRA